MTNTRQTYKLFEFQLVMHRVGGLNNLVRVIWLKDNHRVHPFSHILPAYSAASKTYWIGPFYISKSDLVSKCSRLDAAFAAWLSAREENDTSVPILSSALAFLIGSGTVRGREIIMAPLFQRQRSWQVSFHRLYPLPIDVSQRDSQNRGQ